MTNETVPPLSDRLWKYVDPLTKYVEYGLTVFGWPRWARIIFLILLPISFPLWLAAVTFFAIGAVCFIVLTEFLDFLFHPQKGLITALVKP